MHEWIVLVSSKTIDKDCWMLFDAIRYTIIFITQLVWFYFYPLFYFGKLPNILTTLVSDISIISCNDQTRNGYLLKNREIREKMANMISAGLTHEPRFVVFRCVSLTAAKAILITCFAPILPIIWTGVFLTNKHYIT